MFVFSVLLYRQIRNFIYTMYFYKSISLYYLYLIDLVSCRNNHSCIICLFFRYYCIDKLEILFTQCTFINLLACIIYIQQTQYLVEIIIVVLYVCFFGIIVQLYQKVYLRNVLLQNYQLVLFIFDQFSILLKQSQLYYQFFVDTITFLQMLLLLKYIDSFLLQDIEQITFNNFIQLLNCIRIILRYKILAYYFECFIEKFCNNNQNREFYWVGEGIG
eukprot:TRINITY_DN8631_c0_g2_i5.p1 TRINITY_DN8631_c0_g2~~TRINITY_DN8631_c0_g2_i5.p1  ORF type:complete len:217 (-),score=-33.58 TRINITY_DN8631_c0_g2_i5:239-889(-)